MGFFLFFVLFGLTLAVMYIAIRRELAPLGLIAALGMVASILTMVLALLSRGAVPVQSILFGILIGAGMAGLTLFAAWYFHREEKRAGEGGSS